jgi:hypothetical protein
MLKALKRIKEYDEIFGLSHRQSLYLIYKAHGISFPILSEDLVDLLNKKILNKQGEFTENFSKLKNSELKSQELIPDEPQYTTDISKEVYKYMLSKLCFKDTVTGAPIAINPEHFKKSIETELKDARKNILTALGGRPNFVAAYNLFLSIFPSATTDHNKRWVAFYKSTYKGVNLRIRGRGNAKSFITAAKSMDIAYILYGAFLFVSNGIKPNNTFIGSQTKFFDELDEWVSLAKLELSQVDTKTYTRIFNKKLKQKDFKGGKEI